MQATFATLGRILVQFFKLASRKRNEGLSLCTTWQKGAACFSLIETRKFNQPCGRDVRCAKA